jgi:hypothetical protein
LASFQEYQADEGRVLIAVFLVCSLGIALPFIILHSIGESIRRKPQQHNQ